METTNTYLYLKSQPLDKRESLAKELFETLLSTHEGILKQTNWGLAVVLNGLENFEVYIRYNGYAADFLPHIGEKITGDIGFDYSFSKADESNEEPGNNSCKDWLTFGVAGNDLETIKQSKYFSWLVDRQIDGVTKKVERTHSFNPLHLNPHFLIDRKRLPKK